jgi:hypothetical protein
MWQLLLIAHGAHVQGRTSAASASRSLQAHMHTAHCHCHCHHHHHQMARTQKNKATSGHLGMLKVRVGATQ